MQLFDTHCHLDVAEFDGDRDEVLAAAHKAGVTDLLVPAVERATWPALLTFCDSDPHLHPALGLHPVYLDRHSSADVAALDALVSRQRPVAIGEIGLDWYVPGLDRDRQQSLLEDQLAIAGQHRLPAVLHVRKAHDQMLNTLKRHKLRGGVCHAFNGSLVQAGRYLDMGFRLGFGGMLTFERSNHLRRLAVDLPLEAIVLETDAPDMTVASHQYERNSPEYLPEVLHVLATLRGLPPAEVAETTTATARRVFGLQD